MLNKKNGDRSRWCRELQRRCGSKQLWDLVSFSGRWDPHLLEEALRRPPPTVLKHLCQVVFKHTLPVPEDTWLHAEPGVDTACRMQDAIERREQWLWDNSLPLDAVMNNDQRRDFLKKVKQEYANTPLQQQLAAEDRLQTRKGGERTRWCRELQRRCGSKQMWELVSFNGRWDPNFLRDLLNRKG